MVTRMFWAAVGIAILIEPTGGGMVGVLCDAVFCVAFATLLVLCVEEFPERR